MRQYDSFDKFVAAIFGIGVGIYALLSGQLMGGYSAKNGYYSTIEGPGVRIMGGILIIAGIWTFYSMWKARKTH